MKIRLGDIRYFDSLKKEILVLNTILKSKTLFSSSIFSYNYIFRGRNLGFLELKMFVLEKLFDTKCFRGDRYSERDFVNFMTSYETISNRGTDQLSFRKKEKCVVIKLLK